jgi:hypothetical protein
MDDIAHFAASRVTVAATSATHLRALEPLTPAGIRSTAAIV